MMLFGERRLDALEAGHPGPGKLALVANPRTRTGPRDPEAIRTIARRLGAVETSLERPHGEAWKATLLRWHRAGIRSIAVLGGDGTIGAVLTSLEPLGLLPAMNLVLLDGGSVGLLARTTGARDAWRRVLESGAEGATWLHEQQTLRALNVGGRIGFLAGIGLAATVSRDFQKEALTRTSVATYAAKRIAGLVAADPDTVALTAGFSGALEVDHTTLNPREWVGAMITTLDDVAGYWGAGPGVAKAPIRVAALPRSSPIVTAWPFWQPWTADATHLRVVPDSPIELMIDGEFHALEGPLEVKPGPRVSLWYPEAPVVDTRGAHPDVG